MANEVLHITFTEAGAENLLRAVEKAGCWDEVIGMPDCLSFGPINPPDLQTRQTWLEEELDGEGYEEVFARGEVFWDRVLSDKKPKVLWVSRRCAVEYAGFLETLWRLGDTPCSVVDVTDATVLLHDASGTKERPASLLGLVLMQDDYILERGFLDQAKPLTADKTRQYRTLWERLRRENAPFRVVNAQGMSSAPVTHFDESLLSFVAPAWKPAADVAGAALMSVMNEDYFQFDMQGAILFARLKKLVANGVIESRGDLSRPDVEVRLARR